MANPEPGSHIRVYLYTYCTAGKYSNCILGKIFYLQCWESILTATSGKKQDYSNCKVGPRFNFYKQKATCTGRRVNAENIHILSASSPLYRGYRLCRACWVLGFSSFIGFWLSILGFASFGRH